MLFWPLNIFEDLMPMPLFKLSEYAIESGTDNNLLLSFRDAAIVSFANKMVFVLTADFPISRKRITECVSNANREHFVITISYRKTQLPTKQGSDVYECFDLYF